MKSWLYAVGLLAAATVLATPATAQNYPWCAQYSGGAAGGGGMNCGFVSFDQCMATVRGMGGFCIQNNTYVRPPGPHAPTGVPRRSRY